MFQFSVAYGPLHDKLSDDESLPELVAIPHPVQPIVGEETAPGTTSKSRAAVDPII